MIDFNNNNNNTNNNNNNDDKGYGKSRWRGGARGVGVV
jgi:hypothetical protein